MTDFAVFAQQIIDELTKEGRKHTADTRKHSANRILMFMGDNPTSMDKWDELFVQDYEAWILTLTMRHPSWIFLFFGGRIVTFAPV